MGMKYLKRRERFCTHIRWVNRREYKKFPNDDYGVEDSRGGQGDEDSSEEENGEELGQIEDKGKHLKMLAKRKG